MPTQEKVIHDSRQVLGMVQALARSVHDRHRDLGEVCLVGIRTGGVFLAARLQALLTELAGVRPDAGVMDITLYRDDWTRLHAKPRVGRTEIPFSIDERVVVLVDDVLYTGRTARGAMDALIDFGRPKRIELATLIDRGGRELPIQPDYVGAVVEADASQVIEVELTEGGAGADRVVSRPRDLPGE